MILANIVWPALYLVDKLTIWYVVIPCIIIEAFFYGKAFCNGSLKKGIILAVIANLITTLCGIFPICIIQLTALIPTLLHDFLSGLGTFAISGWISNGIWCIAFNVIVEYWVAKLIAKKMLYTKETFILSKKAWLWVLFANIITFAFAMIVPFLFEYKTSIG